MSKLSQVALVRKLIHKTFLDLGIQDLDSPRETILIQNGHFCGRRFSYDCSQAVWFCEENEVKFYDAGGSLVKVLVPDVQRQAPSRSAA